MAALNAIAREWADEIREGIAWVVIWRTGRSWNAEAVWLNPDDDTFEPDDLEMACTALEQDPNAVMLNGYYCGHFDEDMTAAELAAGIRWHYENGYNRLSDSAAFPPEPIERPADLPADMPWYEMPTSEQPDPYIYDGHMSVKDFEHMHELIAADKTPEAGALYINGQPCSGRPGDLTLPDILPGTESDLDPPLTSSTMELTLTIGPEAAVAIVEALRPAFEYIMEQFRKLADWAVKTIKKVAEVARKAAGDLMDGLLYNANDHPKWWHLYKHARKARTRKKYRRRLMQQLLGKVRAASAT